MSQLLCLSSVGVIEPLVGPPAPLPTHAPAYLRNAAGLLWFDAEAAEAGLPRITPSILREMSRRLAAIAEGLDRPARPGPIEKAGQPSGGRCASSGERS